MSFNANPARVSPIFRLILTIAQKIDDHAKGFHVPFVERRLVLMAVDASCIALALLVALLIQNLANGILWETQDLLSGSMLSMTIIIGWWFLAYFTDLYDIPASCERATTIFNLLSTFCLSIFFWLLANLIWPHYIPDSFIFVIMFSALPLLLCWRLIYVAYHHRFFAPHRILIVGHENSGQLIASLLKRNKRLNFEMIGFVPIAEDADSSLKDVILPVFHTPSELPRLTTQLNIDEIVVAIIEELTPEMFQLLVDCQGQGVQVSWMADLHTKLGRSIPIEHIGPTWALCAMQGQPVFNRVQMACKRALDLVIVLLAIPLLWPILLLVMVAIKLDSSGPIFYRQIRVGRGGKPYTIYKFRTMAPDAEKGKAQWASTNDPRITRVGRILRKARLDEIPQLWNIFKGEMSIVGPRPERPEFVTLLEEKIPFYRTRLLVKPGLTGWAQIHYDYTNSIEGALYKLQYDFYYVRYWSLWLDLYTMFKTVFVVLKMKGA